MRYGKQYRDYDIKEHYKMYKSGKIWLFAGLSTIVFGAFLGAQPAQAAQTTPATVTNMANSSAAPVNTNSATAGQPMTAARSATTSAAVANSTATTTAKSASSAATKSAAATSVTAKTGKSASSAATKSAAATSATATTGKSASSAVTKSAVPNNTTSATPVSIAKSATAETATSARVASAVATSAAPAGSKVTTSASGAVTVDLPADVDPTTTTTALKAAKIAQATVNAKAGVSSTASSAASATTDYPVLAAGETVGAQQANGQVALTAAQIAGNFAAQTTQDNNATLSSDLNKISSDGTVYLTDGQQNEKAHVSFDNEIDFSHNFEMTGELGFGIDNGTGSTTPADGVGIVFSPGSKEHAQKDSKSGGGLGIAGLANAIGVFYDPWVNSDENDPTTNAAHTYLGWRTTDASGNLQPATSGSYVLTKDLAAGALKYTKVPANKFDIKYVADTGDIVFSLLDAHGAAIDKTTLTYHIADSLKTAGYSLSIAASTGSSVDNYAAKIDTFTYSPKTNRVNVQMKDTVDNATIDFSGVTINANIGDKIAIFSDQTSADLAVAQGKVNPNLVAILPKDNAGNVYAIVPTGLQAANPSLTTTGAKPDIQVETLAKNADNTVPVNGYYLEYTVQDPSDSTATEAQGYDAAFTIPVRQTFKVAATPVDQTGKALGTPVDVLAVDGQSTLVAFPGVTTAQVTFTKDPKNDGSTAQAENVKVNTTGTPVDTSKDTTVTQNEADPIAYPITATGTEVDGKTTMVTTSKVATYNSIADALNGQAAVTSDDKTGMKTTEYTSASAASQGTNGTDVTAKVGPNGTYFWAYDPSQNSGQAVAAQTADLGKAAILVPTKATLESYIAKAQGNIDDANTKLKTLQANYTKVFGTTKITGSSDFDQLTTDMANATAAVNTANTRNTQAKADFGTAEGTLAKADFADDQTTIATAQKGYSELTTVDLTNLTAAQSLIDKLASSTARIVITAGGKTLTAGQDGNIHIPYGTTWTAGAVLGDGTTPSGMSYVYNTATTQPTTAGTYTVAFSPAAKQTLTTTDNVLATGITSQNVIIDQAKATVALSPVTKTYDGKTFAQETLPTVTYTDVAGKTATVTGLTAADFTIQPKGTTTASTTTGADAGTYTLALSDAGIAQIKAAVTNYAFDNLNTAITTDTVTKAPVTITAPTVNKVYDGKADSLAPNAATITGQPTAGDTLNYTLTDVSGDLNVGQYALAVTADAQANPNYAITTKAGQLTITAKTDAPVTVKNSSKVYDGTATTDYTKLGVTLPNNAKAPTWTATDFDVTKIGKATGNYTYTLSAQGLTDLNAANTNYHFSAKNVTAGNYVITKAPVTITAPTVNKVYDGQAYHLAPNAATITGQPTAGDALNYTLTDVSGNLNVGQYALTIMADAQANPNYAITTKAGQLTITAKTDAPITVKDSGKVYDGTATTDYTKLGVTLPNNAKAPTWTAADFDVTEIGKAVGSYTYTLSAQGLTDLNAANTNYRFDAKNVTAGNYVITKAPVTITAPTVRKVYDGQAYHLAPNTATITGQPTAGDALNYTLTDVSGDLNVGQYAITVMADAKANPNYAITLVPGALTITQATVTSQLSLGSNGKAYDGQKVDVTSLDPTVSFTRTDGKANADATYTLVNGDYTVENNNSIQGTYTVALTAQGKANIQKNTNYTFDLSGATAAYTINPEAVTSKLNLGTTSKAYDGQNIDVTSLNPTISFTRADGKATADASYALQAGDYAVVNNAANQGTYTVALTAQGKANIQKNSNYTFNDLDQATATYTINPEAVTSKLSLGSATKVYDGQKVDVTSLNPTISFTRADGKTNADATYTLVNGDYTVENNNSIQGTYTVALTAQGKANIRKNSNYTFDDLDQATATYTINPEAVTSKLNLGTTSKVYDGQKVAVTSLNPTISFTRADGKTNADATYTLVNGDYTVENNGSTQGTYNVVLTDQGKANIQKNSNYTFDLSGATATYTISPETVTSKLNLGTTSKVYDGQKVDVTSLNPTISFTRTDGKTDADATYTLANGDYIVANNNSAQGTYTVALTAQGKVNIQKNSNYTFNDLDQATATYTINPEAVTSQLSLGATTKVYDGQKVDVTSLNPTISFTRADGKANADASYALQAGDYAVVNNAANQGTYTVALTAQGKANIQKDANYTFKDLNQATATYTITKAPITSVALEPGTKIYDGQALTVTGNQPTLTFTGVDNDQAAVTLDGATDYTFVPAQTTTPNFATKDGIHAGTYTVTLTQAGLDKLVQANTNYDFTKVDLAKVATTTYTVAQAPTKIDDQQTEIRVNSVTIKETEATDLTDHLTIQTGHQVTVNLDNLQLSDFRFVQNGKQLPNPPAVAGTYIVSLTDAAKAKIAAHQNYALTNTDWFDGVLTIKRVATDPNDPNTSTDVTVGETGTVTDIDQIWDNGESTQVKLDGSGTAHVTDTTKDGTTDTANVDQGSSTKLNGSTTVDNTGDGSIDISQTTGKDQSQGVVVDGDGTISHYHEVQLPDEVGQTAGKIDLIFDGDTHNTLTYIEKTWPNGTKDTIERDSSSHQLIITQTTTDGKTQNQRLAATGASVALGDLTATNEDGMVTLTQTAPATDQAGAGLLQVQLVTTQTPKVADQAAFVKHDTVMPAQITPDAYFETTSTPDPTGTGFTKITTNGHNKVTVTDKVWNNGDDTKVTANAGGDLIVAQTPKGGATTSTPVAVGQTGVVLPGSDGSYVTVGNTAAGITLQQTLTNGNNTYSTGETIPNATTTPATVTPENVHEVTVTKDPSGGNTVVTTDQTGKTTEIDKAWSNGDATKVVTNKAGGVVVTQTPKTGPATTETGVPGKIVKVPGTNGSVVAVTTTDHTIGLQQTVPTTDGTTSTSETVAKSGDATTLTVTPTNHTETTVTKDLNGGETQVITDEKGHTTEIDKTWANGDATKVITAKAGSVVVTQTPKTGTPVTQTVTSGGTVAVPGSNGTTVTLSNTDNGVALQQTTPTGTNDNTIGLGETVAKTGTGTALTVVPANYTETTVTENPTGGVTTVVTNGKGTTQSIDKRWSNGDDTKVTVADNGTVTATNTPKGRPATTQQVAPGTSLDLTGTDNTKVNVANNTNGVRLTQTVPTANGNIESNGETVQKVGSDLTVTPSDKTKQTVTKDPNGGTTAITQNTAGKVLTVQKLWHDQAVTNITVQPNGSDVVTTTDPAGKQQAATVATGTTATVNGVVINTTVAGQITLQHTTGTGVTQTTQTNVITTQGGLTFKRTNIDPNGGQSEVTRLADGKVTHVHRNWNDGDQSDVTLTENANGTINVVYAETANGILVMNKFMVDATSQEKTAGKSALTVNPNDGVNLTHDYGDAATTQQAQQLTDQGDSTYALTVTNPTAGITTVNKTQAGTITAIHKVWTDQDKTDVTVNPNASLKVVETATNGTTKTTTVPQGTTNHLGTNAVFTNVTNPATTTETVQLQHVVLQNNGSGQEAGEAVDQTGKPTYTKGMITTDPNGGVATVTTNEDGAVIQVDKTWPNGTHSKATIDPATKVTTVTQTTPTGSTKTETVQPGATAKLNAGGTGYVAVTTTDQGKTTLVAVTGQGSQAPVQGQEVSVTGESVFTETTPDPNGGSTKVTKNGKGDVLGITKTWSNGAKPTTITINPTTKQTKVNGTDLTGTKPVTLANGITVTQTGTGIQLQQTQPGTTIGETIDQTGKAAYTETKVGTATSVKATNDYQTTRYQDPNGGTTAVTQDGNGQVTKLQKTWTNGTVTTVAVNPSTGDVTVNGTKLTANQPITVAGVTLTATPTSIDLVQGHNGETVTTNGTLAYRIGVSAGALVTDAKAYFNTTVHQDPNGGTTALTQDGNGQVTKLQKTWTNGTVTTITVNPDTGDVTANGTKLTANQPITIAGVTLTATPTSIDLVQGHNGETVTANGTLAYRIGVSAGAVATDAKAYFNTTIHQDPNGGTTALTQNGNGQVTKLQKTWTNGTVTTVAVSPSTGDVTVNGTKLTISQPVTVAGVTLTKTQNGVTLTQNDNGEMITASGTLAYYKADKAPAVAATATDFYQTATQQPAIVVNAHATTVKQQWPAGTTTTIRINRDTLMATVQTNQDAVQALANHAQATVILADGSQVTFTNENGQMTWQQSVAVPKIAVPTRSTSTQTNNKQVVDQPTGPTAKTKAMTLPQTSDATTPTLVNLGLSFLAATFGLVGLKRRKKNRS